MNSDQNRGGTKNLQVLNMTFFKSLFKNDYTDDDEVEETYKKFLKEFRDESIIRPKELEIVDSAVKNREMSRFNRIGDSHSGNSA